MASHTHASMYEDVALADMTYDEEQMMYFYLCPCGDEFEISLEELWDGEDVAPCPSCSLKIRVLFDEADLPPLPELEGDEVASVTQGLRGVDLSLVGTKEDAAKVKACLEDDEGEEDGREGGTTADGEDVKVGGETAGAKAPIVAT